MRSRTWRHVALFPALMAILTVYAPPAAAQEDCTVDVTPGAVVVGGQVLMSGSGFAPDVAPVMTLTSPDGETQTIDLAEFPPSDRYRTDAEGDFSPLDLSFGPSPGESSTGDVGEWQLALSDGACTAETAFHQAATFTWTLVQVVPLTEDAYPSDVAVATSGDIVIVGRRGQPGGVAEARPIEALAWHSADGESWSQAELPVASDTWADSVTWHEDAFAAIGAAPPPLQPAVPGSAVVWDSGDGTTWAAGTAPAGIAGVGQLLASGEELTIVGAREGPRPKGKAGRGLPAEVPYPTRWTSEDGVLWTPKRISKTPGYAVVGAAGPWPGAAVVAGCGVDRCASGVTVWRTDDGQAWRSSRVKSASVPSRLALAAGRYYLQTDDGIWTSLDGGKWTRLPQAEDPNAVVGAFGHFGSVAMSVGGEGVAFSYDGETWERHPDPALVGTRIVDFAELPDGRVIVVGAQGEEPGATSMHVWMGEPAVAPDPSEQSES